MTLSPRRFRFASRTLFSVAPLLLGALSACAGNEPPPQPPPAAAPSSSAMATPPAAPASASAPQPAPAASASSAPPSKATPALSLHDAGFSTPESVLYDAKNDVYLVSNINGSPSAADNNGFISRVAPDGSKVELKWIEAGKNGVKLDAPKGSAITGGVLYVADITRLRTFDAETGKPKGDIALAGCSFANDVAAGPDGKVYVSDSGIKIDDKGVTPTKSDAVYVVEKGKAKTLAKGEELGHPNGLLWANDKLWVVTTGSGEIYSLDNAGKKDNAQKLPKGSLDGIVSLDDTLLVSSWDAQGIYRGKAGGGWELVLSDLKAPADIGYDTKRSRVLVPRFQDNAIETYALP
jgi:sugar lactone lactonase YvrE